MGKGNPANLVQNQPSGTYSPETLRAWRSKGGKASGPAKREYKRMRDLARQMLAADTSDDERKALLESLGFEPSNANCMLLSAMSKAIKNGDIEAARFMRDTAGDKPTEAMSVSLSDKPLRSLDLSQMSDAELEALADKADDGE